MNVTKKKEIEQLSPIQTKPNINVKVVDNITSQYTDKETDKTSMADLPHSNDTMESNCILPTDEMNGDKHLPTIVDDQQVSQEHIDSSSPSSSDQCDEKDIIIEGKFNSKLDNRSLFAKVSTNSNDDDDEDDDRHHHHNHNHSNHEQCACEHFTTNYSRIRSQFVQSQGMVSKYYMYYTFTIVV